MRRFKRRRLGLPGWMVWGIMLTGCTYLAFWVADTRLLPPLEAVAESEARLRGVEAVNRIVLGSVGHGVKPEEMVVYDKDQQGRIAAYHINTRMVNQVAAEAAAAVKDEFRDMAERPISVPLGALTGSRLLGSAGPHIAMKLVPVGSVVVDIKQDFRAAGINQTRHTIGVKATAMVRIVLPLISREVEVATEVPITDTVIVGEVPAVYGGSVGSISLPVGP